MSSQYVWYWISSIAPHARTVTRQWEAVARASRAAGGSAVVAADARVATIWIALAGRYGAAQVVVAITWFRKEVIHLFMEVQ